MCAERWGSGRIRVKREDAAAEFCWLEAEGGGVECAGDDPQSFGAAGCGEDAFGMTTG